MVLRTLNALGTGFDCASKGEMQAVLEMGVDPSRIIYANPCKQVSHLRYAAAKNIRMMTFDNADELRKVKLHHPNAQLVLRILTDDSKSVS
jgi:ornithine decarboxylase